MNSIFFRHATLTTAVVAALLTTSSCKRLGERVEITESRTLSEFEPTPKLGVSTHARFSDEPEPGADPLVWTLPDGWSEAERSQMRPVNLRFGPNGEGECYLSVLPGGGGGTLANVNRWRKQMGQEEIEEEGLANLPRRFLMGVEGVFVSVDGDYANVGAAESLPDYRMLGVIATLGEAGLFVKMVGPKVLVESEMAAFDQFVNSLALRLPSGGGQ
jgi:hypothetical protein